MTRSPLAALLLGGCLQYHPPPEGVDPLGGESAAPDSATSPTTPTETGPFRVPETGLGYELYVRSFQDSDGDGVGDLQGVRSRLDYLAGLGVTVIWLMPVFESSSVSGYATTDYLAVEPDYGELADLEALTADAAARGMRIVLDITVNNAAADHPGFVEASADPGSPWRDRFVFADTQYDTLRWFPTTAGDWYYAYFSEDQPDFDWTSEATRGDFAEVLARFHAAGVRGWRADAVRQLVEEDGVISDAPGCHEVMAWFVEQAHVDEALVIAEAYYPDDVEGLLAYLGPASAPEADLVLDTARASVAVGAVADEDPAPLRALIDTEAAAGASRLVGSFYASHDTDRLPVRVGSVPKRRLLEVMNFTLPGLPILYYGEEIDLPNGEAADRRDEPQRTPMPWDSSPNAGFTTGTPWFNLAPGWETTNVAAATADPGGMYALVSALSALRARSVALREGTLSWEVAETDTTLAWRLTAGDEWVVVAANFAAAPAALPTVDGCRLTPEETLSPAGYAIWGSEGLCDLAIPGNQ